MEEYGSIQQLKKKEPGAVGELPIYPTTMAQAVYDAKTGASLEAILAQYNNIYVQYQGSAKDTRNIIPERMRRAGMMITYMNMEGETVTERAASAVQKDNDHWGLDVNWARIDELSLAGDISVTAQGTWVINGEDTKVAARGPKGDNGLTPWLKTINNRLHYSYDNVTWEVCSEPISAYFRWSGNKIQISRDNKTWSDLSGEFADNLRIKGYVATKSALPSSAAQGDIYGVGPTYAEEDTARTNPIYRYYVRNANTWVDNGSFTSIAAGIVQDTGDSENVVMSQKAVSAKLSELGSKVGNLDSKSSNLLGENLTKFAKNGYYNDKNEFVEDSRNYVIQVSSVCENSRISLSNISSFEPGGTAIIIRDNSTKSLIKRVYYSELVCISDKNYIYDLKVENSDIYTIDIYYGEGNDPTLSIRLNLLLFETFDNKIDLIESSVVEEGVAIKSDGEIISNPNYKCYKIRNNNFSLIAGQANTYKGFLKVAFYNGEPSQSTFISGSVQSAGNYLMEQYNLNTPVNCEYILVCESVGVNVGHSSCFIYSDSNKIYKDYKSIEHSLASFDERIVGVENGVGFMLDKKEVIVKKVIEDFTIDGYYQNSGTEVTSGYSYISSPLINVNEGDIVYLHNWKEYTDSSVGVIWCYDNDNKPYNGNNARIHVGKLTKISDGEYQFIIPSNCSQIGISIAPQYPSTAYVVIGDGSYRLTDSFKKLISEGLVVSDENTGDNSAKYYLKGNSNIVYYPSKKLGIIAAGQSNIDGRNSYSDLPSGFVNPNSKVHFCNNVNGTFSDFQIKDGGSSNDWSFDAIVYDLLTNPSYGNQSEIYVMKKSMGGTSIDKDGATDYHWTADYEYLSSEKYSLLRDFEKIIRKAVEQQGDNFEIKAFVWHQGEGDTVSMEVANRYYDNLKNMLAYVRGIVGNPRLHFFCGSISKNNTASTYKDIINEAYFKLASEDAYFHLVDLSEAVLEDHWHFNYEWSIYFGKMVYDLMIDCGIIEGVKVNPIKPSY